MPTKAGEEITRFYLDSSAFLNGADYPPAQCRTTGSILAEFRPGGRSYARVERYRSAGLAEVAPSSGSAQRVRDAATRAGSLGRLSGPDMDLLAAAVDGGSSAVLVTDDHTMLDVARRLGVEARPVQSRGIQGTLDWRARCSGCGRYYEAEATRRPCAVCGAEVRLKPAPNRTSRHE